MRVFGKPVGDRMSAESYDPKDLEAPLCRIDLTLNGSTPIVDEVENCVSFHGAACGFSATLKRR